MGFIINDPVETDLGVPVTGAYVTIDGALSLTPNPPKPGSVKTYRVHANARYVTKTGYVFHRKSVEAHVTASQISSDNLHKVLYDQLKSEHKSVEDVHEPELTPALPEPPAPSPNPSPVPSDTVLVNSVTPTPSE